MSHVAKRHSRKRKSLRVGQSLRARNAKPSTKQKALSHSDRIGAKHSHVARWLDSPGSARALMQAAHDAVILRDSHDRIESWNAEAARLYGWSAKEAIGKVTHTLFDTKFPVSLKATLQSLRTKGYWEGELHHRRKDGTRIIVESRQALLRDAKGKPLLIKEINRDVTQERRQLSYLRLLTEVNSVVNQARTIDEASRRTLAAICAETHWCVARACMAPPANDREPSEACIWYLSDEKRFAAFRKAAESRISRASEEQIAQRVLKKGKAVWIRDLHKDPYFSGMRERRGTGLVCAFGFPVFVDSRIAMAIALFSDVPMELDDSFTSTMENVGRHIGRIFQRLSAEEAQRRLSVSLLRAQDDERRRIARELHDSVGQYLSALTLAIDAARSHEQTMPPAAERRLEEANEIIQRCSAELRTLSHLLHPPLLEELGLTSAINWYVDGFAERSGVQVKLEMPPHMARPDRAIELAVFRALQECLTNIHRHSGSKTAAVKIEVEPERILLEVADDGKGIDQEILGGWFENKRRSGVGISGMRERVKDLGGVLEIESSGKGTTVRATIPLLNGAAAAPAKANSAGVQAASSASHGSNGKASTKMKSATVGVAE